VPLRWFVRGELLLPASLFARIDSSHLRQIGLPLSKSWVSELQKVHFGITFLTRPSKSPGTKREGQRLRFKRSLLAFGHLNSCIICCREDVLFCSLFGNVFRPCGSINQREARSGATLCFGCHERPSFDSMADSQERLPRCSEDVSAWRIPTNPLR
jgi:hypothetical protein